MTTDPSKTATENATDIVDAIHDSRRPRPGPMLGYLFASLLFAVALVIGGYVNAKHQIDDVRSGCERANVLRSEINHERANNNRIVQILRQTDGVTATGLQTFPPLRGVKCEDAYPYPFPFGFVRDEP